MTSDTQRLKPAAMHRIRYTQGRFAVIDYADDRQEAIEYAAKVGGKVECWDGVKWDAIE